MRATTLACLLLVGATSALRALPTWARPKSCLRAALAASAATATRLLDECAKEERSLPTILGALKELEQEELPTKLKRSVRGDWKLVFASDQDAAAMLLTGQGNALLAVEAVLTSFGGSDKVSAIEVLRPFGPFGNRKSTMEGRWNLEKDELNFKFTYMTESSQGRGTRELELPPAAKAKHAATVTHASDGLLVLRRSAESFVVLSRLPNLLDELIELRVESPPEPEPEPEQAGTAADGAAAAASQGAAPSLPGLPSLPDPRAVLNGLQKQADKLKGGP